MSTNPSSKLAFLGAAVCALTLSGQALTITIPNQSGDERRGTLTDAIAGVYGTGEPHASDLNTAFASQAPWSIIGDVNSANGLSNGGLTITLTSGAWGSNSDAGGEWWINPSFWNTHADAAISMHVGNGQGDPDHFIWLITPGETHGTWSYDFISGGGGGLSNLQLWGSGTATHVPDSGMTAILLGLGLMALGLVRQGRRA